MQIVYPQGSSGGGAANVMTNVGNPNGVVTATGPAICIDPTTVPHTLWTKSSAGTSNNEWN